MKWFDEMGEKWVDSFYSIPSPTNRPDCPPASWIATCMLYHLESTKVNYFEIKKVVAKDGRTGTVGSGLYPMLSLINHSCNPSTQYGFTDGGTMFLYALQSLPAGSDISLSYRDLAHKTKDKRREFLEENFGFICECEACINEENADSTRINCPDCRAACKVSDTYCQKCNSTRGLDIYKWVIDEQLPEFYKRFQEGGWNSDAIRKVTKAIKKAETIFSSSSLILRHLREILSRSMTLVYGVMAIE